jgi:hypothetical protein
MDTKEFKKQKHKLEKEFLEKMLALAEEAGVSIKGGEFIHEGARNHEGKYVMEPRVRIRFEI